MEQAGEGQKIANWAGRYWDTHPKARKWIVMGLSFLLTSAVGAGLKKDPRNGLVWVLQPFSRTMREVVKQELTPVLYQQDQQAASLAYIAEVVLEDKNLKAARQRVDARHRAEAARLRERARLLDRDAIIEHPEPVGRAYERRGWADGTGRR